MKTNKNMQDLKTKIKIHIDKFECVNIINDRLIVKEVVSLFDNKLISTVFKAFCDENRIQILKQLQTGEKCACVLLDNLQISQPTLSHHMKILCDSGIVVMRKEGKWAHYSISPEGAAYAAECLQSLTSMNISGEGKPCCDK